MFPRALRPGRVRKRVARRVDALREFLSTESAGGVLLLIAAAIGLVWANSPWSGSYHSLFDASVDINIPGFRHHLSFHHLINDGFMALFFLVAGLEIKRELVDGELSTRRQATLPVVAALGGMVLPALAYAVMTVGTDALHGWGVPMATDIALVVGVLGIMSSRVSPAAKVFALAFAIVDDIGAIIVIAVFYGNGVSFGPLAAAAVLTVVIAVAARSGRVPWPFFVAAGLLLWALLFNAGVHATLAGVIMGLLAPAAGRTKRPSVLERIEHYVHPYSSFLIVPLFALANMGIEISTASLHDAWNAPAARGIALGLIVGKPVGIAAASLLAIHFGLSSMPDGMTRRTVIGIGALGGIGFTVSLFVAELAYTDPAVRDGAKLAVLGASVVAALIGVAVLTTGRGIKASRN